MKTCKVWIFDIGRGLSATIKTPAGKWIMIDLGSREGFNPVSDFMLPKIKKTNFVMKNNRFLISQLIISHPHDDHMTALKDFDKKLYPSLLTTPNDITHQNQPAKGKINWGLVTNPSDELTNYLRKNMLPGRQPPLKATEDDKNQGFVFKIYYLLPGICEESDDLKKTNYTNNISIISRLNYKGNVVLFTGDMMKDGMKKIISIKNKFRLDLAKYGVDFLIAPHHGLRSSFSTDLFNSMKGNKTRKLNIIPERQTPKDSNEIVDTRYSDSSYSGGFPVVINGKRERKRMLKTSGVGHIRIDLFENKESRVFAGPNALSY